MEPVVSTDDCAFTFTWRIENFSQYPPQKGEVLKSPLFIADSFNKSAWRIHMYPRGNIDGKCVEIYLFREDSGPERISIIYELSFLTADDKPHIVGKFKENNITKGETLVINTYPTVEEVFDTMRSTFLPFDTLAVRCRLWKPDETGDDDDDDVIHCSARTRIGVERKSYMWQIPDFSDIRLGEKITENITSPWDFHDTITLELYLSGTKIHKAALDIRVIRENLKAKTFGSCRLSVIDHAGKPAIFKEYENWGTDLLSRKQFRRFLYRRELMDKENDYLPEDVLSLHFDFFFTYIIQIESSETSNYTPDSIGHGQTLVTCPSKDVQSTKMDQAFHSLQDDLLSLYDEQVFSDFKLQTTTKVFPVHKIVLCARSSFFKALFTENKEGVTNAFNVPDVDSEVLDKMLLFMYTGTVQNLEWEIATKLYYAAYKFGISSLRDTCSEFLISNFAVSNICDILMLLIKSYDRALETAAHEFILRHDNEIMLSRKWVNFVYNEAQFAAKTMHILYMKKLEIRPELCYLMYTNDASTQTNALKRSSEKNCQTET